MQTEELQIKIGREIKRLRHDNDWTQEDVAGQLYIGRDAYGDIERGKTDICLSRLAQIANLFGVDVTFLFGSAPCTTNYNQYNTRVKNGYYQNHCQLHFEEKLKHELEKAQLTIEHLSQKVEDKQKIIDVYEKTQ